MAVVGALCTAASSLAVASLLGAEEYGRYAFGMAWATVLLLPVALGQDRLLLRQVAAAAETADWATVHRVMGWSARTIARAAVPILLIGVLLILVTPANTGAHLAGLALIAVPAIVYTRASEAVLRGLGYLVRGQLGEAILRPVLVLAGIAALHELGRKVSGSGALVLQIASAGLAFLILAIMTALVLPRAAPSGDVFVPPPQWRAATRSLTAAGLLQVLLQRIDVILLALLAGPAVTGLYAAVAPLAAFATFGLTAAAIWVGPAVAASWHAGERARLQQVLSSSSLLGSGFAAAFACVLLPVAPWLLHQVGPEYAGGRSALAVLLAGNVVNAAAGPVVQVLLMTGHERDVVRVMLVALVSAAVLLAVMVPAWGALGAAGAISGTMMAWNLALVRQVRRRCGVEPSVLWWLGRLTGRASSARGQDGQSS